MSVLHKLRYRAILLLALAAVAMPMLAWIARNDVPYRQKPEKLIVRCHEQMCAPISLEHARFRRHFSRGDAGLSLLAVRDTALLCECEFRDSDDMFHSSSEDHLRRGQKIGRAHV